MSTLTATHTVTLMKAPGCGGCIATDSRFTAKLKGSGLEIDRIDISDDADAYTLVTEVLNYRAAPVVIVRDADGQIVDHWTGLNLAKISDWSAALITEAAA